MLISVQYDEQILHENTRVSIETYSENYVMDMNFINKQL